MGTTPKNKAIDAEYLLKQFKALNTKVFEKTYSKIKNAIFTGSFSHNRKAGTTIGTNSFAEGYQTTASGENSHAEGYQTTASGENSHAEGNSTIASKYYSHAEGDNTTASGMTSHAEGDYTTASGDFSHAEGSGTTASGSYSHAEGKNTIANGESQHVQGKYNIADTTSAFIIGNGTSNTNRSNAFTVDKEGVSWSKKDVKAGSISLVGVKNDLDEKIGDYHLDFGYKSKSEVAIVTNKTITVLSNTFTWNTENDKTFICTSNNPFSDVWNPTDASDICGFIFKVVWDGTEYILLGHERDRSYAQQRIDEQYLFGNTSLLGYSNSSDDDTIPFLVVVGRWGNTNTDQKSLKILTNDTSSASHTISISRIEIDYKKIPPYYLNTSQNFSKLIHKGTAQNGIVIGLATDASGEGSVAEGECTIASGYASHAEGYNTTASGQASHAEGQITTASGQASHAEGYKTTASNAASHAEGQITTASGQASHAEGYNTTASGTTSHAEGYNTTASNGASHAEGYNTTASGKYSHAEGFSTTATNHASHASGKYNAAMTTGGASDNTTGTAFVIGNGTGSSALSNAFSVQYSGIVKAKSTITASTTADYAEFFEWLDKNPNEEDRVGHFVTLDGDKIKIATSEDDYILGIVSGEPFVLGNGDCDTWNGMYLHDEFRRTMYEPAPKMIEILDSEGNPTGEYEEVEGEYEGTRPILNPDYDPTQEYVSRFDRVEWSPVGMLGVLAVLHDGTAEVNGYVTVNNQGIATKCTRDTRNSYRVIKKVSDKVVEVIFR